MIVRIGDKLISRSKLNAMVERILEMRAQGMSQQEVALRMGVERTFISRLEGLGEIRQGKRIAVVGFPVQNKEALIEVLEKKGVDFYFLMTNAERWHFIQDKSGLELFNEIMSLIMHVRACDQVIVIGSDLRIRIAQALLDQEVIPISLGDSPIEEDRYVDPAYLEEILAACRQEQKAVRKPRSGKGARGGSDSA